MKLHYSDMIYTREQVERFRKFHDVTKNGVVFDWWLVNCNGAGFCLIREPHHTDEDMFQAIQYIKRDRDVAGMIKVAKLTH